jgi:hypothetical protein
MAADPKFTPVTVGCAAGEAWPAGMVTDAGTAATFGLLLERLTVTAAGAAADSVTERGTDWPGARGEFAVIVMLPADCTVTVAVPFVTFGMLAAEAVMVAVPRLRPVTGTEALVAPCAIVTVEGTDTTPEGTALRLTVMAAGAGADNVTVRFSVASPVMVEVCWVKLKDPLTATFAVPVA